VRPDAYDPLAEAYAEALSDELGDKPFDREVLAELARLDGPIVDLGCGPGQVAGLLAELGADTFGVDGSPGMVEQARRLHPTLRFEVGDFTRLALEDGAVGGLAAFYAIVHLRQEQLADVFREWRRVLRPGGRALIAFHVGDESVAPGELFGVPTALTWVFHPVAEVVRALEEAAFTDIDARVREPYPDVEHPSRRAYVFARS